MSRKAKILRRCFATAIVIVVMAVSGYLSAYISLANCSASIKQHAKEVNLRGIDFDNNVYTFSDMQISSNVAWPFIVKSTYSLPRGLHATQFEDTHLALFGYVVLLDQKAIYLV